MCRTAADERARLAAIRERKERMALQAQKGPINASQRLKHERYLVCITVQFSRSLYSPAVVLCSFGTVCSRKSLRRSWKPRKGHEKKRYETRSYGRSTFIKLHSTDGEL